MTREEKINTLKAIIQECEEYQSQRKETLFEIIKDLEQETVSKESYNREYFLRKEFDINRTINMYIKRKIKMYNPSCDSYSTLGGEYHGRSTYNSAKNS